MCALLSVFLSFILSHPVFHLYFLFMDLCAHVCVCVSPLPSSPLSFWLLSYFCTATDSRGMLFVFRGAQLYHNSLNIKHSALYAYSGVDVISFDKQFRLFGMDCVWHMLFLSMPGIGSQDVYDLSSVIPFYLSLIVGIATTEWSSWDLWGTSMVMRTCPFSLLFRSMSVLHRCTLTCSIVRTVANSSECECLVCLLFVLVEKAFCVL